MNKEELIRLDCLGDICPAPMIKFKQKEKELSNGSRILLITDHSCVSEGVKNYCRELRYSVEVLEPVNGVWELYISRQG